MSFTEQLFREIRDALLRILVSWVMGAVLILAIAAVPRYGPKLFVYAGRVLGVRGAEILIIVIIFGAAWLAHEYKRKQQIRYGLLEVAFGILAVTNVALGMIPGSSTLSQGVALVASGYIIARGLNNVRDGRAEKLRIESTWGAKAV